MNQSVLSDITPYKSYDNIEVMICGKGYCSLFHQSTYFKHNKQTAKFDYIL